MVPGVELVAGYLVAWAVRKARRVGGRADVEVDRVVDAGMDRLHALVSAKLGGDDAALARLERDAAAGVDVARSGQRVRLAVEQAAEDDAVFAQRLRGVLAELAAAGDGVGPVVQQVRGSGRAQQAVQGWGVQTNVFGAPPPR